MSDKDGAIGRELQTRNDHTSQRSDAMLLPKWVRWAGLGLCAAMAPPMAAVAKPATNKSNKTNTGAQHGAVTKTAKSSKTATAKNLSTSKHSAGKHSAGKLNTSSKSAHAKKLSKTSKSHTAQTRQHSNKATKLSSTKHTTAHHS